MVLEETKVQVLALPGVGRAMNISIPTTKLQSDLERIAVPAVKIKKPVSVFKVTNANTGAQATPLDLQHLVLILQYMPFEVMKFLQTLWLTLVDYKKAFISFLQPKNGNMRSL